MPDNLRNSAVNELLKTQQELKRTQFALNQSMSSFYMVDKKARIIDANETACQLSGYSREELLNMTVHDLDPDFLPKAWQRHWTELKARGFLRFESKQLRKDGSTFPVEIESNYKELEGQGYNFAFLRDITERRKREQEKDLNEAVLETQVAERTQDLEDQRKAALELAKEAENARIRAETAEKELTTLADQLTLPQTDKDFHTGEFHINGLTLKHVVDSGRQIRGLSRNQDSLVEYTQALASYFHSHFKDSDGRQAFGLIQIHLLVPFARLDETQQTTAREQMPEISDDTLCLVCTASKTSQPPQLDHPLPFDGILPVAARCSNGLAPHFDNLLLQYGLPMETVETDGSIIHYDGIAALHVNRTYSPNWPAEVSRTMPWAGQADLIGFAQGLSEGIGFILTAYSTEPVQPENAHRFVYLSHSVRLGMLQFFRHAGHTQAQIHAVDSLVRGHEAFATEQEERLLEIMGSLRTANEELQHTNEELDKFAFAASHDLKSPLFALITLIDMIEEDTGDTMPKPALENFSKAKQRLKQMEGLLEAMLQYSRIGLVEDSAEEQDLNELLDSVIGLLDPPQKMKIAVQPALPTLLAPRGALLRIFSNLISNAIKHGQREDLSIRIFHKDRGKFHEFTISDDGVGIDHRHHTRVFHLFKTLEPKYNDSSSGMGLSLVKKTVEHYGGTITIDSEPGEGTFFTFSWPKKPVEGPKVEKGLADPFSLETAIGL